MPAQAQAQQGIDDANIVTKAFFRAVDDLGHKRIYVQRLLDRTGTTVSSLRSGNSRLRGKDLEVALLYLRIYRSLSALMGGNMNQCRMWLEAPNRALGGNPQELITSIQGLVNVADYLDSMRG